MSTNELSPTISRSIFGKAARNGATIGASPRSIAGGGALIRRRPDGTPRRPRTWFRASPTSDIAGPTRASSNSPASVSPTLRVVRFIRRTPSRSSMSRSRWLRLETGTRCSSAARRKFRVRATATKASRSRRSKSLIVRYIEQGVRDCPAYRDNEGSPYPALQAARRGAAKLEESNDGKAPTRFNRPGRRARRDREDVVDGERSDWKGGVTFMNASAQKMTVEVFGKAVAETEMTADSKRPAKKGRHPRSRVALLISFAVGLLLADPARATTVHAKYKIFYLGLPVGDMETVKTFGVSTYQTSVDARVAGIATIVSNFKELTSAREATRSSPQDDLIPRPCDRGTPAIRCRRGRWRFDPTAKSRPEG